jgi:hypothetical protein
MTWRGRSSFARRDDSVGVQASACRRQPNGWTPTLVCGFVARWPHDTRPRLLDGSVARWKPASLTIRAWDAKKPAIHAPRERGGDGLVELPFAPLEANALLVDFKNLGAHRKWIVLFVLGTLASTAWYAVASRGAPNWPSGASAPGLTFGIAAGLLILFEFFLWPRKTLFRVWRIGRTQAWMRAHIWLGLLTVPLIVLHSWRELGGTLTTVLVLLFAIVIASGIWGLVVQQFLPRAMLAHVPAETIYSQIAVVVEGFRQESRLLVRGICGDLPSERISAAVGVATVEPGAGVELLEKAFVTVIEPYLSKKPPSGAALADAARSANFFRGLRDQLPVGYHSTIDRLEACCDQRRQFALQARLHFWLHNWLWVHLPLSAALVVLMLVHVVVALKFW